MENIDKIIIEKANNWLSGDFDQQTKNEIKSLMDKDPQGLIDAFYKDLEFGTGGLRGIMGAGTNRMNKYTVGMSTQGLANYLKTVFSDQKKISVAIAFDSRNNSDFFAKTAANVLTGNGINVFLFDELRPTPELSFTIRYLKCQAGIVITASHNPKEYNGYKVYWDDGSQLVPPHDKNVIAEVKKIKDIHEVNFEGNDELLNIIGKAIDQKYIEAVLGLSLSKDLIDKHQALKIVYTPIHGTGYKLVPDSLKAFGFKNVHVLEEQKTPDGNFPTVVSPNPEEPAALKLALKKAIEINADLVLGTDPDTDRVGIAIKNFRNEFELINGNQTAAILIYYLLNRWKEHGKLKGREYIIKTIVTSDLLKVMAEKNNVECHETLTGFKWIADKMREIGNAKTFIGGGEESFGYLAGDFVRDKDAVISCCLLSEALAYAKEKNKNLYELLVDIYKEYGFYKERLLYIVKKGKQGSEAIQKMMETFREKGLPTIDGAKVIIRKDYLTATETNLLDNSKKTIPIPKSNVLQFIMDDQTVISMRPSGTEPKIKFYFSVRTELKEKSDFEEKNAWLERKIDKIIKQMHLDEY